MRRDRWELTGFVYRLVGAFSLGSKFRGRHGFSVKQEKAGENIKEV